MATTTTTIPTLGEVLDAVENGDVDTVRRYVDGGGDPNVTCRGRVRTPQQTTYFEGETLLMVADDGGKSRRDSDASPGGCRCQHHSACSIRFRRKGGRD
jgi:hypothetical protein